MNARIEAGPSSTQMNKKEKSKVTGDKRDGRTNTTEAWMINNKAPAHGTHVVVRGNNKDKSVIRETVGRRKRQLCFLESRS